jgi:cell division protein YceG involved in septum cleavage
MAVRKKNPIFFFVFILIFILVLSIGGYSVYQSYQMAPMDKTKIKINIKTKKNIGFFLRTAIT